ncbi:low affinity sulfate transporter [Nitrococcus mobilis Nb-231]|uniref:Low affinity sulfate transporter n=1 Tax=Nitrococcus mobilis Nb-231 TaxID=314278 RepID=A4BTF9_9GAMM|nr:low affinity sulfate transporter [Nitrococcus mobilis Nb-231]
MGVLRLGKCVQYIPYPVVSGFMSGIGVIIILLQIYPFLGLPASPGVLAALESFGQAIANAEWAAAGIATLTITVVYLSPRIIKAVPGTLLALLAGTAAAILFKLDIPTIGEIPTGFPELRLSLIGPAEIALILIPALTLAALGALDSLLTSMVADNLTKTHHDSNRELIGQGIGNTVVGIIGGIPGAGATMRTAVNIKSGGRGRLSGVIHGLVLLAILAAFGPYASRIPMAVLAGILITVGIGIIDYRGLRHFRHVPRTDFAVMLAVLLLTVLVDLLQAVAVGMIMASLFFIKRRSIGSTNTTFKAKKAKEEGGGRDRF